MVICAICTIFVLHRRTTTPTICSYQRLKFDIELYASTMITIVVCWWCAAIFAMVGHRQKRALDTEDVGVQSSRRRRNVSLQSSTTSPIADSLMNKWAWGAMSSVAVQEVANACRLAHVTDDALDELASMGSYGLNPGHIHRDLLRLSLNIHVVCIATLIHRIHLSDLALSNQLRRNNILEAVPSRQPS